MAVDVYVQTDCLQSIVKTEESGKLASRHLKHHDLKFPDYKRRYLYNTYIYVYIYTTTVVIDFNFNMFDMSHNYWPK